MNPGFRVERPMTDWLSCGTVGFLWVCMLNGKIVLAKVMKAYGGVGI